MRPLEAILVTINLVFLLWWMSGRVGPSPLRHLAIITMLVMAAQFVIEGRRWQIYPAYAVTLWLLLALAGQFWTRPGVWASLAGVGMLLASVGLCLVLPVFQFPKPTGPYAVGTAIRHLVDTNREETHAAGRGALRELMVQIWYPAAYQGSPRRYRSREEVSFLKEHASLIMTNASVGVAVAQSRGDIPRSSSVRRGLAARMKTPSRPRILQVMATWWQELTTRMGRRPRGSLTDESYIRCSDRGWTIPLTRPTRRACRSPRAS